MPFFSFEEGCVVCLSPPTSSPQNPSRELTHTHTSTISFVHHQHDAHGAHGCTAVHGCGANVQSVPRARNNACTTTSNPNRRKPAEIWASSGSSRVAVGHNNTRSKKRKHGKNQKEANNRHNGRGGPGNCSTHAYFTHFYEGLPGLLFRC